MPKSKRLRVFAGPNGSGKSGLFNIFKKDHDPGYFINADNLENELKTTGFIDLLAIGLKASDKELISFNKTKEAKSLIAKSTNEGNIISIEIKENCIVGTSKKTHSYEASFVAAFIRWLLYKEQMSFSFETVMSHISKVNEMKAAQKKGYRTYLYFICTDDSQLNVQRVADRVEKGGHNVDPKKIISRYPDTLNNLHKAIKCANRTYLFDNSGKEQILIAEIFEDILQLKTDQIPNWFIQYVLPYFRN